MLISFFLVILIFLFAFCRTYLSEYIEVTKIYKVLRKLLETRDLILLKILNDINNKKLAEKVLNLVAEREVCFKISYDDAIKSDIVLHHELKAVYEEFDKLEKNELQKEIFRNIISLEKQIRNARKKYTEVVNKYNLSLTLHPKLYIKTLHMKPFDVYESKKK